MTEILKATRDFFESQGYDTQGTTDDKVVATYGTGRRKWLIEVVPQPVSGLEDRTHLNLTRKDKSGETHTWPFDHVAGFQQTMDISVPMAVAYGILDDPDATDDELQMALAQVGSPSRRGQVGYSGNRMDVAVLADVMQRLLERVRKLEK